VYFPLVVSGAMMIEPTETESRGELNRFARAMIEIAELAREAPDQVHAAPHKTEIQRPDETNAARNPILRWTPQLPQK
jgi:glycine dehydrogenase subunit 2